MPTHAKLALAGIAAAAALVLACHASQAPVLNLRDVPMRTASGRLLDQAEVRDVLLEALRQRKWMVESDRPGRIEARVYAGGHKAAIRIDYAAGRYSIERVSSSPGLRYEADRDIIHKRYNHWVDRLRVSIHAGIPAE